MKSRLSALAAAQLVMLLATHPATCQPPNVEQTIKHLGKGTKEIEEIHELAKTPEKSVSLLIDELHVVPEGRLLAGQYQFAVQHVLWCIRALRFITGGKDFCAQTSHAFGGGESERRRKYFLEFSHGSCIAFFSIWPSKMSTYIAPSDAQEKIIQQWKEWFNSEGSKLMFKPLSDPKPEQWLW
jgi:hypothetical protein